MERQRTRLQTALSSPQPSLKRPAAVVPQGRARTGRSESDLRLGARACRLGSSGSDSQRAQPTRILLLSDFYKCVNLLLSDRSRPGEARRGSRGSFGRPGSAAPPRPGCFVAGRDSEPSTRRILRRGLGDVSGKAATPGAA